MMALKGLARYMRFIAKRERIISPIWIVAMVGLTAGLVAMYPGIFPTEEAMLSMAQDRYMVWTSFPWRSLWPRNACFGA